MDSLKSTIAMLLCVFLSASAHAQKQSLSKAARDVDREQRDLSEKAPYRTQIGRIVSDNAIPPSDVVTPSELDPPLNLKIFVPPKATLPSELQRLTMKETVDGRADAFTAYRLAPDIEPSELRTLINHPDVDYVEIERPIEVERFIPIPFNEQASISHLVPQFVAEFQPEGGLTVAVAVFDGGAIRDSHQEFQESGASRITLRTSRAKDEHATHVAGTIGARGAKPKAKGMAPRVKLVSYDFFNDTNELETLGSDVRVTNHSYGPISGWDFDRGLEIWRWWGDTRLSETEDAKFGKYTGENTQVDDFLHRHSDVITVVAAGNDRNDEPSIQPIQHAAIGVGPNGQLAWRRSNKLRPRDGGTNGFDTISGLGLCKNVICIGAIHDVPTAVTPITVTEFSGFGPADDGRIKPDLVANGFQLLSTSSAEDDAYLDLSGTSMASPTASGICALLVELYAKVNGRPPMSAEIKAALIHTARDAGLPGPDGMFGWGSINALRAGRVISGQNSFPQKLSIARNEVRTLPFKRESSATGPIRVTLVWTDPAAVPNSGGVDDATPTLVNNLDLRLIGPNGVERFPYSLDAAHPEQAARNVGPNSVDNVEVVDSSPIEGDWTIEVKGTAFGMGAEQECAIIISGLTPR